MPKPVLSVLIENEYDVVSARQRGREIAALAGFDGQDQTRVATALSEIARNAFQYAGGGKVEFLLDDESTPQALVVRVSDRGPGITKLESILGGQYRSRTGMGLGMTGARRLVDQFSVESSSTGTLVTLRKELSPHAHPITAASAGKLTRELAHRKPQDLLGQVRDQNQELMHTLDELRQRHEEVQRLNRELEETNRGVVALHTELEDKAERLKHADEMKSRFLSHMSHEFRTPLNSILALCRILLSQIDGPLTAEQQKQVGFIRSAGQDLYEMVNDLLDLAKIEAGKIEVRPSNVDVAKLFGTLRGIFKPLIQTDAVVLVFDVSDDAPEVWTDENKLAQILRNFISNAVKFTDRGEIRVSAARREPDRIVFSVKDTGIGIEPEHQARIFDEFTQLDSASQRKAKGTGLGLSLSKKLAELLGGHIELISEPGVGSTFSADLPLAYSSAEREPRPAEETPQQRDRVPRILIVDDEEVSRYVIRRALAGFQCVIDEAPGAADALSRISRQKPDVILLDLRMPEKDGFEMLRELKGSERTVSIPVIIITSKTLTLDERDFLEREAATVISKEALSHEGAPHALAAALSKAGFAA